MLQTPFFLRKTLSALGASLLALLAQPAQAHHLPLDVVGGTVFQRRVWAALRRIPAGRTVSYGQLARSLGLQDPRAAIDVGAANAANPVALIVPCHRVGASDGSLRGYAWGLARKRWLLVHEHALADAPQTATLRGF